jgi:hypothetical protein
MEQWEMLLQILTKAEDALSMMDKAASASDDAYTSYYFTKKAGLLALL